MVFCNFRDAFLEGVVGVGDKYSLYLRLEIRRVHRRVTN